MPNVRTLGDATEPRVFDFRNINDDRTPRPVPARIDPRTNKALSTRPKELRNRVRTATKRGKKNEYEREFKQLYKPIEEWDKEELARGRPRDRAGGFRGQQPKWITRELHEEAITRFKSALRDEMNSSAVRAVDVVNIILEDEEIDSKGRPLTPRSVKLDAAKFLVEHVIGKPKQHVETDISVKLQGMLATAVITPGTLPAQLGASEMASPRSQADLGIVEVEGWEDDD